MAPVSCVLAFAPVEWRPTQAKGGVDNAAVLYRTSLGRAHKGGTHDPARGTPQSWRMTVRREELTLRPPLYSMNPSFLNLFMKKFTRERVVPIMSARVS